jgi:hypothetical protein
MHELRSPLPLAIQLLKRFLFIAYRVPKSAIALLVTVYTVTEAIQTITICPTIGRTEAFVEPKINVRAK